MAYTISTDITLLGKSAKLDLTVKDKGKGQGDLSFHGSSLDLKEVLNDLIEEIKKNDTSFESPFDSISFPDIAFNDFKIETFDNKAEGSGMTLLGEGNLNGNDFTVKYGTYAPIAGKGAAPQSFSLLLHPFTIDHIPAVNIHLDKPIKINIEELGVVTAPFYDESKKRVESGFYIRGYIEVDGERIALVYPGIGGSPTGNAQKVQGNGKTPPPPKPPVTKSTKGSIKWININRSLGPAKLKQIGVQWKDGKVWLLVNAGVNFGGIELDVMGLKAGEKIGFPPPIPVFGLDGLGLAFNKGGIEIAGEFLKANSTLPGVTSQYDGMLDIKFEEVHIEGLGSYAKINGHDSIFAYAFLDYPLGGPAFFFVEGLALGFGYNRELILPPLDKVKSFPLVSQALTTNAPANANDPLAMLSELDAYIPPKEGETLLMAGIKFSTFQILHSFLLLSVSIGQNTRFDLIGLSLLSLPPDENEYPIVFVEIALEASVVPDKGLVKVQGLITNKSYIYVKEAHLSGGFAFYSWFKDQKDTGARSGDFVVTLGGYHPDFKKPDYYPSVPRFELNWRVDNHLSLKADAYFAMTPRYGMAGFQMQAVYNDGTLYADFKAGADFLVQWKPFHYDIRAYVSLHIAFTASIDLLFTTIHKTFHLDMSANLHLWGPKLTGHADVHVSVMGIGFSFGVDFGGGGNRPAPLSWSEFKTAFLPKEKSKGLQINLVDGLIKKVKKGDKETWILNPYTLKLKLESTIPASSINTSLKKGDKSDVTDFAVGPMQKAKKEFTASINFDLYEKDKPANPIKGDLQYENAVKKMPAALWGAYEKKQDINADALVDLVNGAVFTPANPPTPDRTLPVGVVALLYATSQNDKNDHWSYKDKPVKGSTFVYDKTLFTNYLSDFKLDDFKQMNKTNLGKVQKSQSFRSSPKAVDLIA